jgi:predicted Zn-dependent peptidase
LITPSVHKTVLENGIRILTQTVPHVHSVCMGVWVNVGARDESRVQSGLSHFIEHMIFKGTRKRDAYQIAKEFDAIGGQTNAFTSTELTCYHAKVMDAHLDTMIDILSDIFLNSEFDPLEVEKERPVILQEIGMVDDNPEECVHLALSNSFWGDHPVGRSILGTRENLLTFDADTVKTFFHRFYQPDRIVISAAGNIEHERFVDIVRPTFESIQPGEGLPGRHPPTATPRICITPRDLEQVHMCLGVEGISATSSDRYALSLLSTIFGGNMSSRLFQEVRERRSLAYSIYSFSSSHVDSGMFGSYAGVSPLKTDETLGVLLAEIDRLCNTPVSASELDDAKRFTKGNILLSVENTDNLMVRLAQNEIYFGRYIPLEEIIDHIETVTREDILQLAGAIFKDKKIGVSILGPVPDQVAVENLVDTYTSER